MDIIKSLRLRRPKGMHVHLRQGELLKLVIMFSNIYGWILAIGNLEFPVRTAADVINYAREILENNISFKVSVSVMLTEDMTPDLLEECHEAGARVLKYMPWGSTTNSQFSVKLERLEEKYPVFQKAEYLRMVATGHWELPYDPATGQEIPFALREQRAIPYLAPLVRDFPGLTIGAEHISGRPMLKFVQQAPANVFGGITAHHIACTKLDMYRYERFGSFNPHYYCMPILKEYGDCLALMAAICDEGNNKLLFAPDDAPHLTVDKETLPKPPFGISAPGHIGVPLVIHGLEQAGFPINPKALNKFFSGNAERVYGLPPAEDEITLVREPWIVPAQYNGIVPLWAGRMLNWRVKGYEF